MFSEDCCFFGVFVFDAVQHVIDAGLDRLEGIVGCSTLQNCHFYYSSGLHISSESTTTLSSCTIQYSHGNGINLSSQHNILDCIISNNAGHGVNVSHGFSTLRRNNIQHNQGYGIVIGSSAINLGTTYSHGRNFIRYNNGNGYQIYSIFYEPVPAVGNF